MKLGFVGVKFRGAFVAGNCAEKPVDWVPIRRGGAVRIPTQKVGNLQKIGR